MEFEAKIPLALDPSGITVSIDEAYEYPRYYRCIECNDYLQVRHGDVRAWYFAHYPQTTESAECSLRTVGGIENLIEDLRTSPIEKSEQSHNLRIAIIPDFYTGVAKVVALIQNPLSELNDNMDNVTIILNTLQVKGNGLLNGFDKRIFRPSRPVVRLELDPDTTSYKLDFESNPELKGLNGQWVSKGINVGDIFAGERGILERIENYRKISESSSIFEVIGTKPQKSSKSGLKIGKKFAIERTIDELIIKNNEEGKKADLSLKSFDVDVIEPQLSDPWGEDVIYGSPDSEALLAIRPRLGLDPEFEIVSVPKTADSIAKIGRVGKGKIRYHRLCFPSFGSYRITIHHADSHVYLHFFATRENTEKVDLNIGKTLVGITYIDNENKFETVYPWENRTIYLKRALIPQIKVFHPEEFPIEIEMKTSKEDTEPFVKQTFKALEFTNLMDALAEEDFKIFLLKFKGFGSVRIRLSETPQKLELREIIEKIQFLGIDPHTRATWDVLRKICDVAPGTPHKILHDIITPKKVRRALKLLQEGDHSDQ